MTWLRLALANLTLTPLTTAVNVLLMALGVASIVLLLLASTQLANTMSRDARGIDLVLGAPGSPVQLVLAAVYHADVPPGNIALADAQRWANDPRVSTAIPLSLGDSFRSFRIVGTSQDLFALYNAEVSAGRLWEAPLEAVLGASVAAATGLKPGATFAGAHGLVEGGHDHDEARYRVVGHLAPTGTVLDRLIVTSVESVWAVHGDVASSHNHEGGHAAAETHKEDAHDHHDEHGHDNHAEHGHNHEVLDHGQEAPTEAAGKGDEQDSAVVERLESSREITAMLLAYRSPIAAASLPRQINVEGVLQAAAPAVEVSRVLQLVGLGITALGSFAWLLVATAALSIFAALYGAMRNRRGELAMLRCLGATRLELSGYLLAEGLIMTLLGVIFGFVAGHLMMEAVGAWLEGSRGVSMTGWVWVPAEGWLVLGLLGVGALSALLPAAQAYRTDPAQTLARV